MDPRLVEVVHKKNHLKIEAGIVSMSRSIPSQQEWDMKGREMVGYEYNHSYYFPFQQSSKF